MKILAGILLMGSLLLRCLGEVVIPNEYWIEPNTNGLNSGTLGNPFWGYNQATFDTEMSNLVSHGNVVVHLLAGTYHTAGEFAYFVGPNTTISGSSMDATIVQFALTNKTCQGVFLAPGNDHVIVQDLTVDCNGSNNILSYGIALIGNFEAAKRVKVINAIGNASLGYESFPIGLGGGPPPYHDLVAEDCVVTNCLGNYGDAFAVSGGNSCILNCRAYLPIGSWVGINCADFNNAKIIGNHIESGLVGFYMDTDPGDGILLQGNTFNQMNYGIQFNNGSPITNLLLIGNIIHLGTNVAYYPNHAIQFSGNQAQSVQICQNIIVGNNTGRGDDSLSLINVTAGIIANNILDNRLIMHVYASSTNVWMFNNVDQNGNYAAFGTGTGMITPVSPSNPVNRIETPYNYTVSYNDYFIGVTTTSAVTITLPYAQNAGSGKTYIIQSESGSTPNITIAAQSGQSINGASTTTITSSYKAITVISDGNTKWYAH